MYQALYRKWRPRRFDDVVGQDHITETLKRQVEGERLSHAYLFTGTRGTGKTSCAKILAKAVNCENPQHGDPCNCCESCKGIDTGSILDVLELDAASNNGVDQVRALRDEAVYTPAAVKKRVYIIDEVHMLSTPAFNALLKILEEPPPHLMFILATTELHKVPATIKSRCQQFSFKRILPEEIRTRLDYVAKEEGILLSEDAARLLSRLAEGGLRDALSLLDQCIGGGEDVTEADVLQVLGLAGNLEIAKLFSLIVAGNTPEALECTARFYREGKDMAALLGELSALLRDLMIRKTAPHGGESLLTAGYEEETLRAFAKQLHTTELLPMLSTVQAAASDLYRSSNRRTDVELCIIRLSEKSLSTSSEALLARISRLEEQIAQGIVPVKAPVSVAPQVKQASAVKTAKPTEAPPWDIPEEKSPVVPVFHTDPVKVQPEREVLPPATPSASVAPKPTEVQPKQESSAVHRHEGQDWKQFAPTLRGKIPPSAFTFLSKSSFVTGVFEELALRLYVDSDMTKTILSRTDVVQSITEEAERYTGRALQVHLQVGKPEEKAPELKPDDKLNDLLKLGQQFGNITIK